MRATYSRKDGVRHLLAGYCLTEDRLYGHVKTHKKRTQFLQFCRYLRSFHPTDVRIAVICDNFSPHLSTKKDTGGRGLGVSEQRRDRLHADEQFLTEPDPRSRHCGTSR